MELHPQLFKVMVLSGQHSEQQMEGSSVPCKVLIKPHPLQPVSSAFCGQQQDCAWLAVLHMCTQVQHLRPVGGGSTSGLDIATSQCFSGTGNTCAVQHVCSQLQ